MDRNRDDEYERLKKELHKQELDLDKIEEQLIFNVRCGELENRMDAEGWTTEDKEEFVFQVCATLKSLGTPIPRPKLVGMMERFFNSGFWGS